MKLLAIIFDELSACSLGCYGGREETPNIDALAAVGDIFTNCYADASAEADWAIEESHPFTRTINSLIEFDHSFQQAIERSASKVVFKIAKIPDSETADDFVAAVVTQLKSVEKRTPAIMITSLRGSNINTGLAGQVGEAQAHVPLIVSRDGQTTSIRRDDLLSTMELANVITNLAISDSSYLNWRDNLNCSQLTYHRQDWRAVRTQDWLLVQHCPDETIEIEEFLLFRKPEDLWEILDVAQQYPIVVDHFLETGQLRIPTEIC